MIETKCDVSGRSSGLEAALRNNDFPLTAVSHRVRLFLLSLLLRVSSRFALDSPINSEDRLQDATIRNIDVQTAITIFHPQPGLTSPMLSPTTPAYLFYSGCIMTPNTSLTEQYEAQLAEKLVRFAENDGPFCAPVPEVFCSPVSHYRMRVEFSPVARRRRLLSHHLRSADQVTYSRRYSSPAASASSSTS